MTDAIARFRQLHQRGCFVVPNPWDRGSARLLASLGFPALATSSAGLSFGLGLPDSPTVLGVDAVLAHVADIASAVDLPVTADFQAGYGATADEVAANVDRCLAAGAAGLSIEDASGDSDTPLFERAHAVDRVRAARAAIDASGEATRGAILTARAECFLVGHPEPLRESLERLVAYADAGADCLFAPGLRTDADITAVVRAVAPRPVNVITVDPAMTVAHLAELGVRRISVGSALARVAWRAAIDAARDIATEGRFSSLASATPFATMNALFGTQD